MLLAIDSSAGTAAAVVDLAGGVLAERAVADSLRHAEVVGELIASVLRESGVAVVDLDAVAVGVGPGPFTGLRVGMAAARMFALAAERPLLGVVSHDAVAAAAYEADPSPELLVATDARRRELYWSRYRGLDAAGLPIRTEGPSLAAPAEVPPARRRVDATAVSAGMLGVVAARVLAAGREPAPVVPLYLRSPDVTLSSPKRVR